MEQQDQTLVEQARRELPYATRGFEALAKRYYSYVRQVGRGIVGNHDDADTVAQDVMLRVFHHLPQLRDAATFEGWLRQITTNVAKTHLYRETRQREKAKRYHVELETTETVDTVDSKTSITLTEILAPLNLEERNIVDLRFSKDLTFPEIARHMDMKLSATKMRYYRALEKLQIEQGKLFSA